jgi:HEAT repeat protein
VPPGRGAIELLNQALGDEDETIRIAAAECLAGLGDPLAARELYSVLRTPNDPLIRDAAFRALTTISAMSGQRLASV